MIVWEDCRHPRGRLSHICLRHLRASVQGAMLGGGTLRSSISRTWMRRMSAGNRVRVSVGGGQCSLVCCLSQREWGGCRPSDG
jgi:hypothetical protein